jgi:hypothetical protein
MLRRIGPMLAVSAATALFPLPATAGTSFHLVYVRDPTASACPDESGIRQAVRRRVGYDPFFPWAKTTVVVEISGEGESFVARVRLVDDNLSRGMRELRSGANGCAGLIDATALAISIALDANASGSLAPEPGPAPAPQTTLATPREDPPTAAPAPAALDSAADRDDSVGDRDDSVGDRDARHASTSLAARGLVGFDAVAAIAQAPAMTPGLDVWAATRLGIGSLGLEVRADLPSSVAPPSGGRASVLLVAGTVAPCLHTGPVFGCVLGTLGWLHAAGADVLMPRSGSAFAPAIGPRAGLEVALGHSLALEIRGDLLVNLVHPTVSLNGAPAWTLPPIGGVVATGLAYRFP